MKDFVKVAKKSELPEDTGTRVEINGREIAIFKVGEKVYAVDHICPHAGGPIAEGSLNLDMAMCPWHGWEFNVRTGECSFNSEIKLTCFEVREEGDDVYVKV